MMDQVLYYEPAPQTTSFALAFKFLLCHSLPMDWEHIFSLSLSFPSCKLGLFLGYCED